MSLKSFRNRLKSFRNHWRSLKRRGRLLWMIGARTYSPRLGWCGSVLWMPREKVLDDYYQKRRQELESAHATELAQLKRGLESVVPKLVNLSIHRDSIGPETRYRLMIDLDPFTIREAFEFGNDDSMIRYFSEYIGHMAYRELKTMNMQRFREQPRFVDYHPATGRRFPNV